MELVALIVLLIGGVVGVAFFNKPKTEVVPPKQKVDTTVPVKGNPSEAFSGLVDVVTEKKKLNKMTKVELEGYARGEGIELDRRKTKANMIEDYLQKLK